MPELTGFVVLPDGAADRSILETLPFEALHVISHKSGRAWIVSNLSPDEIVTAEAGSVQVVVIGFCPVTTDRLTSLVKKVHSIPELDGLAQALPGSFHLVASINGQVRVQGSLTGVRRVFHTRHQGMPIASDRADVLAAATGAGVNEQVLAAQVVCGAMLPPPLSEASMWTDVSTTPADHYLLLNSDQVRAVRRWRPPEPRMSLNEGAAALREALISSMDSRHPGEGRLSADLSGGMDSTSLCFLAARSTPELLTFRWGEAETGNDDAIFAAHAANTLPQAEHLVVPQGELPAVFADPSMEADTEQPYLFSRTLARTYYTARLLAERGSQQHLAGHGADELFHRFPGYLHPLLRRHPITAIRHVRGHRALSRWPLAATATALARNDGIATWWREQADQLTDPSPPYRFPPLGWGFAPLRAPQWATPDAIDVAREALRHTAEHVQPFSRNRGQHQFLVALRSTGSAYGQLARIFASTGIHLRMPYLDDQVVETALSVRLHERATPWQYKPLLAEAMRGLVPPAVLNRSTKGEFSEDVRIGWRRALPLLIEIFGESELVKQGLVNSESLRRILLTPQPDSTRDSEIEHLLGCETWFRSARRLPLRRQDAGSSTS
ncbi:asparagine synthase-related protein [Actinomycetota bacterium Odt1-20B]